MIVSAIDYYIHEVVRSYMIDIFDGVRPVTPGYERFRLSMKSIIGATTLPSARINVENDIREQHSYLTFQQPDKISDAIRLVSEVKIWEEVGKSRQETAKDVKDRISLIVDRRNKIAHEADLDPTYPNTRWPIETEDVENTLAFVENVVKSIDVAIK